MKTIAKTYSFSKEYSAKITKLVLLGCLVAVFIYGINLYMTVSRTVAIRSLEAEISKIDETVKQLDGQFIALSSKITPELAGRYGLSETEVSAYINKTTSLGVVISQRSGI